MFLVALSLSIKSAVPTEQLGPLTSVPQSTANSRGTKLGEPPVLGGKETKRQEWYFECRADLMCSGDSSLDSVGAVEDTAHGTMDTKRWEAEQIHVLRHWHLILAKRNEVLQFDVGTDDSGQVMIRVKDQVDIGIDSKFSRAHCWNGRNMLVLSGKKEKRKKGKKEKRKKGKKEKRKKQKEKKRKKKKRKKGKQGKQEKKKEKKRKTKRKTKKKKEEKQEKMIRKARNTCVQCLMCFCV